MRRLAFLLFVLPLLLVALPGCSRLLEGDLAAWLVQRSASQEENFRHSRSIGAIFEPADLDLYRSLLPAVFAMPEHPLVRVNVVDQIEVGPWPLTPYQLGDVALRCSHRGEEGWHVVTMPENKWVAVWTGRTMGFPKYLADEITLAEAGDGWRGEVIHEGALRLRLEFTPVEAPPAPRWREAGWETGGPVFNLRPPGKGPEVKIVRGAVGDAGKAMMEPGVVRVTIGEGEPWAGLVAPGTRVTSALVEWQGGRSLAPEDARERRGVGN